MVSHANAIVDPRAVMVIALDTTVAHRAVSTTTGSNSVAIGTELGAINIVKHFHEVYIIVREVSWLRICNPNEEKKGYSNERHI